MQIIYLLPFLLVSAALGLICLIVPRWRRHAALAVIGPIAFAGCSIVGLFMAILLAERLGIDRAMGFDESWETASRSGIAVAAAFYLIPGAIGTLVAVVFANRVWRRALRRLGF